MSYFQDIKTGILTSIKGLSLTLRHLRNATKRRTPEGVASDNYFELQDGLVTLQYPYEQLPIPDNGRYRLRNEIEDCIVCDKCAKVCPVDCITIDAIKATEEVGRASDGSPIRLYAAAFDIDMAKCCYCGLCTVVCPTECLTMDKKFDYSEFELGKLTYEFSNLSKEQADEKRILYEQFLQEKEAAKAAQVSAKATAVPATEVDSVPPKEAPKRPAFRPTAKPKAPIPAEPVLNKDSLEEATVENPATDATPTEMERIAQGGLESAKHPTFETAPATEGLPTDEVVKDVPAVVEKLATSKPAFRPTMKPPVAKNKDKVEGEPEQEVPKSAGKPAGFRPTMKPAAKEPDVPAANETPKPKPAFKPTMKPSVPKGDEPEMDATTPTEAVAPPKPTPAFRPTMKPKVKPDEATQSSHKTNE
ncbi:4Fe-4S dicluster domain-containing protein [Spirosoma luteum]|uniref:4Fe-4S dicluster domain-containing protein n=1 Tax=Spirosoma luteum TaxID=431553 RepID=UPI0003A3C799|nr:4Fe-4S dicluster domain-containing protein [Spirosoma luteum]